MGIMYSGRMITMVEDLRKFATLVKKYRKQKGMTKEELCQDESELTVRQLTRIESGLSRPTLTKINFLAERLDMNLFSLMPDYTELPKEYLDLKYQLLRNTTYSDKRKIYEEEKRFEIIYENYYEDLPEEEQLIVDILTTISDVNESELIELGNHLLEDYLDQLKKKNTYTLNDLLLIKLLLIIMIHDDDIYCNPGWQLLPQIVQRLLVDDGELLIYQQFVLRDTLFLALGLFFRLGDYKKVREILDRLIQIMERTQDYQKKSLIDMFEWKYYLSYKNDKKEAKEYYESAIHFAEMIKEDMLLKKLKQQWQQDIQ